MSITVIQTIVANAKTILANNLSGWTQLLYENNLEANPGGKKHERFGFIAQPGVNANRIVGRVTFDHDFQMILMRTYRNQDTDVNQSTAVNVLMDLSHDIIKIMKLDKLGQTLVEPVSFEEPEFFNDDGSNAVAIRTNFVVKYNYSAR